MRLTLCALFLLAPVVLAQDVEPKDTKTKAREITVKGLPTGRGRFDNPTKITTKAELEKAVTSEDVRKDILKQVDLKKEYLVLFMWAGSGQDKVEMKEEKGTVMFNYLRGRTRDLRMHAKLFAVPLKTEYKLGK